MTAAIVGLAMAGAATAIGGVKAYYSGKQQNEQLKAQQKAVKQQGEAQAYEQERQANYETARAGVAQVAGEQEAEKRSRILAQDIGSMYANYAGNGLAVDGSSKDTIGAALRTQVTEATSDIDTIRDNAAMQVWTHQSNAASLRASAANTRIATRNQLAMLKSQRKAALHHGKLGLWQTATGLPLVDSTGWSMASSSLGMLGSSIQSTPPSPTTNPPTSAWNQAGAAPKYANHT